MQMAAVEILTPTEVIKTRNPSNLCPDNATIPSANHGWVQHQVDGCSVFFVSRNRGDDGLFTVVYCYMDDATYRRLLALENARLAPWEKKHADLNPNTTFGFDEDAALQIEERYDLDD